MGCRGCIEAICFKSHSVSFSRALLMHCSLYTEHGSICVAESSSIKYGLYVPVRAVYAACPLMLCAIFHGQDDDHVLLAARADDFDTSIWVFQKNFSQKITSLFVENNIHIVFFESSVWSSLSKAEGRRGALWSLIRV